MPSTRRIRRILAIAIVALCVAVVGAVALRQLRLSSPESASRTISPNVDMAMTKLRFSEMRDNAKLWELVADQADYDKDSGVVTLSGVHLETFEGKTGGMVVTSKTGTYNEQARIVKMNGTVHAVSKRGMVFDSDFVEYRPATGLLLTDRPVTVRDARMTLRAIGMELSLKEEKVRFLRQADALIEGKNAKR